MADFQPSRRFTGARANYYFGKGPKGIGYYLDPVQTKHNNNDIGNGNTKRRHQTSSSTDDQTGNHSISGSSPRTKKARGENGKQNIAQILADADKIEVEELTTPAAVKKLLLQFEKRINVNQLKRAK